MAAKEIERMVKMKDEINVVLICDDGYIVPTLVTVYSLLKSKRSSTKYKVNILAITKDEHHYDVFYRLENEKFRINVIKVEDNDLESLARNNGESFCVATPSALLKFYIPNFIKDTDKILYLDGDILVMKDLCDLYYTDLQNVFAAVVKDSSKMYSKRVIVKNTLNYFNSGMMLLNLSQMQTIIDKLVTAKQRQVDKTLMDQDIFNEVISDNVICLPIVYNLLYINLVRSSSKYTMEELNTLYGTNFSNIGEIFKQAYIIHYSSKDKPWKTAEAPMARKWYECYRSLVSYLGKKSKDKVFYDFEDDIPEDIRLKNALGINNCEIIENNPQLIVSLTTYPPRINSVHKVIESIFCQTEIPDKIILWLSAEEFPNKEKDLPADLVDDTKKGLEIHWCNNIKSHKKYYYTMLENPNDIVITIDDDIIYKDTVISILYKCFLKFPNAVSAMRLHAITFDEKANIVKYMDWKQELESILFEPNLDLLATGAGGVLYPPKALHEEVFNIENAEKLCSTTDDIWLKIMQIKKGTKTVLAYPNMKLNIMKETQKEALYKINRSGGNNDKQFTAVLNAYNNKGLSGDMKKELFNEYSNIQERIELPEITVIIPICDKNSKLRECLNSILKQTLKNIEILIIDNGSKGSIPIKYSENNSNIICVNNREYTVGKAINEGLKRARGQYVIIADVNTEYESIWLKKLFYEIKKDDSDVAFYKINILDNILNVSLGNTHESKFHKLPHTSFFSFNDIKEDRFNVLTYRIDDKIYKTSFLRENNLYVDENGRGYGDMLFIYGAFMKAQRIVYVDEILGYQSKSLEYAYHNIEWDILKKSLLDLQKLIKDNCNKFWKDYVNFALSVSLDAYTSLNSSSIEERYTLLKEQDFELLGISDRGETYFYNQDYYQQFLYIKTFDFAFAWKQIKKTHGFDNDEQVELRKAKHMIDEFGEKNKLLDEKLKKANNENRSLKEKIASLSEYENITTERLQSLEFCEYSVNEIRKSFSYKIGLIITLVPRFLISKIKNNK